MKTSANPSLILWFGVCILFSLGCVLNGSTTQETNGECNPSTYSSTCSGGKLTYCQAGNCFKSRCTENKIQTFECPSGCENDMTFGPQCKGECTPSTFKSMCKPDGSIVSCVSSPLAGGPGGLSVYIISEEQCSTGTCVEGDGGARCNFNRPADMSSDMPAPDMSKMDMPSQDMTKMDMTTPDMTMADMPVQDMTQPDMPTMDMGKGDMGAPDMPGPDMGKSDMSMTDMTQPDMPTMDMGKGDMAGDMK